MLKNGIGDCWLIGSRQDARFAFSCCAEPVVEEEFGEGAEELPGCDGGVEACGDYGAV